MKSNQTDMLQKEENGKKNIYKWMRKLINNIKVRQRVWAQNEIIWDMKSRKFQVDGRHLQVENCEI